MDMMFICYNHISFSYSSLMYPHVLWVYVPMFVLEGELKSHAHAFVFVCMSKQ
jgi:hypothetical protein